MSMSRQAGIVLPGYNPLLVANAPTIGTATQATATSVSVAFTAPSCTGGSVISTYSAYCTTTGTNRVTGASSPIVVTGLTTGQAYTFRVIATNIYGPSYPSGASNSVTPSVVGQDAYITAGTYSWVAPAGVTSVSAVVVSGGADGTAGNFSGCIPKGGFGGGGGGLAYVNNLSVTPGSSYSVVVGASSGISSFNSTAVRASGASGRTGGAFLNGTAGFSGGTGGNRFCYTGGGGGGGAAGYSGAGGAGGTNGAGSAAGTGGGAGGGGARTSSANSAGGGGGVGILGQGGNGAAGDNVGTTGGGGGSCGATGGTGAYASNGAAGGLYGGGGGGAGQIGNCTYSGGAGRSGAVRIIYPGTTRSFPSTNTGNL